MKKIYILAVLGLICIGVLIYMDSKPQLKYGADEVLTISDKSLFILYMEHSGLDVYAGDGKAIQYWSGKPMGWKEYYILPVRQVILNRGDIWELIRNNATRIERDDKKILIRN